MRTQARKLVCTHSHTHTHTLTHTHTHTHTHTLTHENNRSQSCNKDTHNGSDTDNCRLVVASSLRVSFFEQNVKITLGSSYQWKSTTELTALGSQRNVYQTCISQEIERISDGYGLTGID